MPVAVTVFVYSAIQRGTPSNPAFAAKRRVASFAQTDETRNFANVELLLRVRKPILERCQPRFGVALSDEGQDRRGSGEDPEVSGERWHKALGIDREVLRRALRILLEARPHGLISGARFLKRDVAGKRTCVRSVNQLEHRHLRRLLPLRT